MPDATISCPQCKQMTLVKRSKHGVELDVCPQCKGVWFDEGELSRFLDTAIKDDPRIPDAELQLDKRRVAKHDVQHEDTRQCPNGHGAMGKVNYAYDSNVFVDICPTCKGVWTDRREAAQLATYLKGNPQVNAIGEAMAAELGDNERMRQLGGVSGDLTSRSGLVPLLPAVLFPLRDDTVSARPPLITLLVIAAMAVLMLLPVLGIVSLTELRAGLALTPAGMRGWELFTASFPPAGWAQFVFNAYVLWTFGDNVEDKLGRGTTLLFFIIGGMLCWLVWLLFNLGADATGLGANGAISAIIGAYIIFFPKAHVSVSGSTRSIPLPAWAFLFFWLVLNVAYTFLYPDLAVAPILGQMAAFAAGLGVAWLLRTRRIRTGAESSL